jgi:hypothetical protein
MRDLQQDVDSGRSGCWHQQRRVFPLAGPQVSYKSSSRTARTIAGLEGIMPKVACATLDFLRPLPLPSLAGGTRISTSVPSGTGSGSLRMITSPFTCPVCPIVQFPLIGQQRPYRPRQSCGRPLIKLRAALGLHVDLVQIINMRLDRYATPPFPPQCTTNPSVSRSRRRGTLSARIEAED